jgi:gluconokinase
MTTAASPQPRTAAQIVVVMGVSGVGKTTVANGIAEALGWVFAEGDSFHSEANREKMAAGHALTDEDRWPWLSSIGDWMDERLAAGDSAVVTCSALRRSYRDLLRRGRPSVRFCELDAPSDLIAERLQHRTGHYMPPSLLPSQLATLEPLAEDEPGVHVSVAPTPEQIVRDALAALGLEDKEPSS